MRCSARLAAALALFVCVAPLAAQTQPDATTDSVNVPGPLRSFLRVAAVSQKVTPEEVLPLLARNVALQGYRSPQNASEPTEYLVLLRRYVKQARELQTLAGPQHQLHAADCEQARPLLAALGYRLRQGCGKDQSVETADPDRAFLTLNSGFPLAALEQALLEGTPFSVAYEPTPVPVLFTQKEWVAAAHKDNEVGDIVDALVRDPELAKLYWAMARMDGETAATLRRSPGIAKLVPVGGVLNFYGGEILVRNGRVLVPGGTAAEPEWKQLVAAAPSEPEAFLTKLLAKDDGWLAAYFDALARADTAHAAYFASPQRVKRFYEALRKTGFNLAAARPVFRPDAGGLLLVSRLRLDASGHPLVPGNIDVWREIFKRRTDLGAVKEWARQSSHWSTPDQLVEGLFGVSRIEVRDGPLQVFLALSAIDEGRAPADRLTPATVRLLADHFSRFGDQYALFAEMHGLNNASIERFITAASALDKTSDRALRGNAIGMFQAVVGVWQVLARQGEIPADKLNPSLQTAVGEFVHVRSSTQLFEAGRAALNNVTQAAAGRPNLSQAELVDLLAGPEVNSVEAHRMREELAQRMETVLLGQRLVNLDTLFALDDGLRRFAAGDTTAQALLPLAAELREFELPRPLFSSQERSEWSGGIAVDNPHAALQVRTDLTSRLKSSNAVKNVPMMRGVLAAFLRDTLVGLNYAYYEPPGAQMLHNNPMFVRSHDFSGSVTLGGETSWQTSRLYGTGLAVGRGAHLVGSLADLPYVLAEAEQDFIVPENVQALIWNETVPTLVTSAVLPRWWNVTRNEMHAAALYQKAGEELLSAAAHDEALRRTVLGILAVRMPPARLERLGAALAAGQTEFNSVMPSEVSYVAAEFARRHPDANDGWGAAGRELRELAQRSPAEASWERLSRDFGVPHRALAYSYRRELLNTQPYPALSGYGSRLLAESWDSTNLYWARLADESGYSPVMLHRLAPTLTRRMVEKIFASELEDWPALGRAMREAGDEFRRNRGQAAPGTTAQPEN